MSDNDFADQLFATDGPIGNLIRTDIANAVELLRPPIWSTLEQMTVAGGIGSIIRIPRAELQSVLVQPASMPAPTSLCEMEMFNVVLKSEGETINFDLYPLRDESLSKFIERLKVRLFKIGCMAQIKRNEILFGQLRKTTPNRLVLANYDYPEDYKDRNHSLTRTFIYDNILFAIRAPIDKEQRYLALSYQTIFDIAIKNWD